MFPPYLDEGHARRREARSKQADDAAVVDALQDLNLALELVHAASAEPGAAAVQHLHRHVSLPTGPRRQVHHAGRTAAQDLLEHPGVETGRRRNTIEIF